MTNDVTRCNYYKNESENVKGRWACKIPPAYFTCAEYLQNLEIPNNKEQCEVGNAEKMLIMLWVSYLSSCIFASLSHPITPINSPFDKERTL